MLYGWRLKSQLWCTYNVATYIWAFSVGPMRKKLSMQMFRGYISIYRHSAKYSNKNKSSGQWMEKKISWKAWLFAKTVFANLFLFCTNQNCFVAWMATQGNKSIQYWILNLVCWKCSGFPILVLVCFDFESPKTESRITFSSFSFQFRCTTMYPQP